MVAGQDRHHQLGLALHHRGAARPLGKLALLPCGGLARRPGKVQNVQEALHRLAAWLAEAHDDAVVPHRRHRRFELAPRRQPARLAPLGRPRREWVHPRVRVRPGQLRRRGPGQGLLGLGLGPLRRDLARDRPLFVAAPAASTALLGGGGHGVRVAGPSQHHRVGVRPPPRLLPRRGSSSGGGVVLGEPLVGRRARHHFALDRAAHCQPGARRCRRRRVGLLAALAPGLGRGGGLGGGARVHDLADAGADERPGAHGARLDHGVAHGAGAVGLGHHRSRTFGLLVARLAHKQHLRGGGHVPPESLDAVLGLAHGRATVEREQRAAAGVPPAPGAEAQGDGPPHQSRRLTACPGPARRGAALVGMGAGVGLLGPVGGGAVPRPVPPDAAALARALETTLGRRGRR
mmetsp:Transcript_37487/g.83831  ORF Transcript_37487/g.83831 Transcript_37487/m.83831 type:complete len:404 (+) Transcript_37487:2178-3389(+)